MDDAATRRTWIRRQILASLVMFALPVVILLIAGRSLKTAFWLGVFGGSAVTLCVVAFTEIILPDTFLKLRARMLEGAPSVRQQTASIVNRFVALHRGAEGEFVFSKTRVRLLGLAALLVCGSALVVEWVVFNALGLL